MDIHTKVVNAIDAIRTTQYEPRTVVCVALTEAEYADSVAVPTYSGTRIILSAFPHPPQSRSDGNFGPNLELLHKAYHAAVDAATSVGASILCQRGPCPGRAAAQGVLANLKNIEANFKSEPPPSYREYSFLSTDGSQIASAESLTEFYEDVAAQSYVNLIIGQLHTIKIPTSSSDSIKLNAVFYEPVKEQQLIPATSLLDFIDARFIPRLSKYYVGLFNQFVPADVWRAQTVQASQIRPLSTIVPETQDSIGVAIASLLCRQNGRSSLAQPPLPDLSSDPWSPRYHDLIAAVLQDYMRKHLTFYCKFGDAGQMRVLDATDLLKGQDTFPLTAKLASDDEIRATLATELGKLEALNVESNQLLNDVKKLVADEAYQAQIARLDAAIKEAQDRTNGSAFLRTAAAIVSAGSGLSGLPNIVQGLHTIDQIMGYISEEDGDLIKSAANYSKGFSDASDKLGSGAASLQKLGTAIDTLRPPNNAAADDVQALRDALAKVQQEYQAVLATIAQTAQQQLVQYLDAINTEIKYLDMQQRLVLIEQSTVTEVVLRYILGARLQRVTFEARQLCPLAAAEFLQNPDSEDLAAVSNACEAYAQRAESFRRCLNSQPKSQVGAPPVLLLFGDTTGLVVAQGIALPSDPNQLSCFGPEQNVHASPDRLKPK
jgi:hypothetical protein